MLASFFATSLFAFSAPGQGSVPPKPSTHCVRYFAIEEIKPDAFRKAVAEYGTGTRIVTGPSTATCRPKLSFVGLEVGDALSGKDVARFLKKGCKSIEELAWTSFRGVDKPLPSIMGVSSQDCVIGMASDMRWFQTAGDEKFFYYVPGKLDADSIAKQFTNLFEPFNAGDIGTVATETLTFALAEPVEPDALKRAVKAIGKIDGVRKLEIAGASIQVEVELAGLHASGGSTEGSVQKPRFHSKPILDALANQKLALAK